MLILIGASFDSDLAAPIALIDAGSSDLEIEVGLETPISVLALTYPVAKFLLMK